MEVSLPSRHASRLGASYPRRVAEPHMEKFFDNMRARYVYSFIRLGGHPAYKLVIKSHREAKFVKWKSLWWKRFFRKGTEKAEPSGY
jgi:hypothetical protein